MAVRTIPDYLNIKLSVEKRVNDLVERMTVDEKISQMLHAAPAIDRLGVPAYNWWNECLHGVARAGVATVFPQAIGLAASWNAELIYRVASAIADEARAKFNEGARCNEYKIYGGLTFWTPNINIFRDPRWGRGQETYGEDPCLTGRLGVNFVQGLQGDHPRYLKVVATPKHFAVHSGPEANRHQFNAIANWRDMRTTYLPAFEAAIKEAKAESIMGAYNRTNGEACCASETLLQQVLREEWGFQGHVVSDCGAIDDIYLHHHLADTATEAAALSVTNGCDLNCGATYVYLREAYRSGLISEELLDRAVKRLFTARFKLGMFDPYEEVPFNSIPMQMVDCSAHRALALEAARESIVLLKNDQLLPLIRSQIKKIAVIGPKANDELVLRGNYYGEPRQAFPIYDGIRQRAGDDIQVDFNPGCELSSMSTDGFHAAEELSRNADIAIVVLGLSQLFEGEEGQEEGNLPGEHSSGDRTTLVLPGVQEELLKVIVNTGTPLVLVLLNGSALAINWAQQNVSAILECWYPGQAGGLAVGDVLFGDYNPSGRLPITFYQQTEDLPAFDDYAMTERTYRYFTGTPLYPFGYGLSYTQFSYSRFHLRNKTLQKNESQVIWVTVKNIGDEIGDEVVQLYLADSEASVPVPNYSLIGFEKVHLSPGASKVCEFVITPEQLLCFDDNGYGFVEPGEFRVWAGGHAPVSNGAVVPLSELVTTDFMVVDQLREKKFLFRYTNNDKAALPYLFYKPDVVSELDSSEKPLLLFLHGMGERGDDLCSLRSHGLPKLIEAGMEFPFFVVSPQCPANTVWSELTDVLASLMDEVAGFYPVDRNRIYISGLSMGGYGTWKMLLDYPDLFAAAAPICGGLMEAHYQPDLMDALVKIPIWNFHGDADPVVPVMASDMVVKMLRDRGGKIRYTRYPGVDHDSWTATYENPALYQWLLSKKLR